LRCCCRARARSRGAQALHLLLKLLVAILQLFDRAGEFAHLRL